jgi:glycosyltransferase involved in cell wall biosynthesis
MKKKSNETIMIKVLHAYIFFSIKFAGGTSDLMFKIAKNQQKTNVQPSIITGDYQIDYDLIKQLPLTDFIILKSFFDKSGFSIMPELIWFCIKDLKKYDVIHMHVYRTYQNLILFIFAKIYGIPIIMDAHGSVPYFVRKPLIKRIFDFLIGKILLYNANFLMAESEVGVQEYLNLIPKLNKNKIITLSPPFDTNEFNIKFKKNYLRSKYKIKEKFIIGFLGRIHFIKGLDFLVKAFEYCYQNNKDIRLVIIGSDDGYLDELLKIIDNLKIKDNVTFGGFLSGEEKNQALFDCNLVVQCSRLEQGAWAPIEALLCGVPIMVTNGTGSAEDIKRLDAGSIIPFGDKVAFYNEVQKIYNNPSPYLKKTKAASTFIKKNLSFNTRINEYKKIYEDAIAQK